MDFIIVTYDAFYIYRCLTIYFLGFFSYLGKNITILLLSNLAPFLNFFNLDEFLIHSYNLNTIVILSRLFSFFLIEFGVYLSFRYLIPLKIPGESIINRIFRISDYATIIFSFISKYNITPEKLDMFLIFISLLEMSFFYFFFSLNKNLLFPLILLGIHSFRGLIRKAA